MVGDIKINERSFTKRFSQPSLDKWSVLKRIMVAGREGFEPQLKWRYHPHNCQLKKTSNYMLYTRKLLF
jgi:hypothetical protein